ncbi:MAG: hemolysin family protein [Pseudomonadota bacterium]
MRRGGGAAIETLAILVVCLLLEGFFSGSEIAVVSMNRPQLRLLMERGSRRARALSRILEKPEWLLSTTLLGTNLAATTLSAVATLYVSTKFGARYAFLTILVTGPLMLLFGEVLPKTLFQRYADRLALQLVVPLRIISIILSPLVGALTAIAHGFSRISGIHTTKRTPIMTREELELLIRASERQGSLRDMERKMIDRIFSLSDRQAQDVMIPLVDVVSVRDTATIQEAQEIMRRSRFSRMPVYSGRVTHMVGWINMYDLLTEAERAAPIVVLLRKVHYVPATVRLDRLLLDMQRAADTLAVVVDEYGGAIGIVTLEDVLEDVVGEIEDEHAVAAGFVRRVDTDRLIVKARIPVAHMNELLTQKIPTGDYETLGGFLVTRLQRIPSRGDEVQVGNLKFRVLTASESAVEEVEVMIRKEVSA